MARLRVGFDGRAFSSPAAGVRRYATCLVPALTALDDGMELVLLGGTPSDLPAGVEHVSEPWHPPSNLGWAAVGLPLAAARGRVDLIHAPAYTAPLVSARPVVVTVHDVSYERHPEWYPYRRDWVRRAFYRRSARGASHVITDSAFSASEIHAAYGIDAARISVVPLGVTGGAGARGSDAPLPGGVATPFVLHVGDVHARRNIGIALEAVLALRARGGAMSGLSLVLAGVDRGLTGPLRALAAGRGAPDALVTLGQVSEPVLEALYRHASALVYPSLYEGFGLPVLEAMANGLPVVAARAASIPEVVDDAGVLIDPRDGDAWVAALDSVLGDADRAARMRRAGLARAATFTWERTARLTADVYRRVAR